MSLLGTHALTTKPLRLRNPPGIAAMLLALCLAPSAQGQADAAAARTQSAALQACPSIKAEIVDLEVLAEGLNDSSAVGLIEKLRLKSAIDEMIDKMKAFHRGAQRYTLVQLEEQYDLLMMRIAGQLQGKDPLLHGRLCNAWLSIWNEMQDRNRFMEKFS